MGLVIHQEQRGYVYKVLAGCFCAPDEKLLDMLAGLAGQDETMLGEVARAAADESVETLKVDHARLFVGPYALLAPPYGSVYLEGEALMGESTMDAANSYRQKGLEAAENQVPDHITAELEFMHVLLLKQTEAIDTGEIETADHYQQEQGSFLARHLGAWVAQFAEKVVQHADTEYYRTLARVTRDLVLTDLNRLGYDEVSGASPRRRVH